MDEYTDSATDDHDAERFAIVTTSDNTTFADIVNNPEPLIRAVLFAEQLERLVVSLPEGDVYLKVDPRSRNLSLDLRFLTASGATVLPLPTPSTNGLVLVADTTQAAGVRWV